MSQPVPQNNTTLLASSNINVQVNINETLNSNFFEKDVQNLTSSANNSNNSSIIHKGSHPTNDTDKVYAISNAVSIVFIIIVALVIFFWRKYQRNKKRLKKMTREEVAKFLDGDMLPFDAEADPESNLPFCIPYNRNFEIDLNEVELDRTQILGSGCYGVVYKGLITNTQTPVAIKTLKSADLLYFKSLLSELKVMAFIGEHENIVKVIGANTAELISRKIYIIMEFCSLGSLESYLRLHRGDFKTFNKPTIQTEYQNFIPTSSPLLETEGNGKERSSKYVTLYRNVDSPEALTLPDLVRFGFEVSNAMDYLSNRKVVHGDLASRNLLLNSNKKVKLTDFGLSREMLNYSTYVKTSTKHVKLPWRWLALETIKDSKFSSKSDVWSFGVTLWEIFSLAHVPYPGLAYSQEFLKMLEKGLRMNSPSDFTPPEIYKIMIDCWHAAPDERPTFRELREKLFELCLTT